MATLQSLESDVDHASKASGGILVGSADGPRSWPDCEWTEEMRTEAIQLFQRALARDAAAH